MRSNFLSPRFPCQTQAPRARVLPMAWGQPWESARRQGVLSSRLHRPFFAALLGAQQAYQGLLPWSWTATGCPLSWGRLQATGLHSFGPLARPGQQMGGHQPPAPCWEGASRFGHHPRSPWRGTESAACLSRHEKGASSAVSSFGRQWA